MTKNASNAQATEVGSDWLEKKEVARRLGCALSTVTRYQNTKPPKLNVKVVDAINYYDPAEVELLREELARHRDVLKRPEDDADNLALATIKACVGLIREPRESIDEILFDMIKDLRARVKELEAALDASRQAVEAAKDFTHQRNLESDLMKSEQEIKKIAMTRMVNTIGQLITGWGGNKEGVAFTPAQLEELLTINADGEEKFFTPEQEAQAKAIVAKSKASTNGKEVVSGVAGAVKTIIDAQGAASP